MGMEGKFFFKEIKGWLLSHDFDLVDSKGFVALSLPLKTWECWINAITECVKTWVETNEKSTLKVESNQGFHGWNIVTMQQDLPSELCSEDYWTSAASTQPCTSS